MVRHSNRLCLAGSPILATIGQFATALTWPMNLPPKRVSAILATTNQFATALMWSMGPPASGCRERISTRGGTWGHAQAGRHAGGNDPNHAAGSGGHRLFVRARPVKCFGIPHRV